MDCALFKRLRGPADPFNDDALDAGEGDVKLSAICSGSLAKVASNLSIRAETLENSSWLSEYLAQITLFAYERILHLQSFSIIDPPKQIREVACHTGLAAVGAFRLLTIALNLATSALVACPRGLLLCAIVGALPTVVWKRHVGSGPWRINTLGFGGRRHLQVQAIHGYHLTCG